ncbi:GGDEF domain-containing protein, partial [Acinetobacter baumannii]
KAIIERLIDEIEYAQQSERRIAVLYFDLDGFKPINDDLGHDAGDLLLQTIASRIKALSDERRFVGRVGGDEFVVIMSVP